MFIHSRLLLTGLMLCGLSIASAPRLSAEDAVKIHADVVYGHKDGMALTVDILQPAQQNGAAVLLIQSGGWYSGWIDPQSFVKAGKLFFDKGYALVIVRHGSAPRFQVPDAVDDVRRAVRFVRWKAKDYGIDENRLGVQGGSAGGHLTLMLATTGDEGDANAQDEVLRHSSRIAAGVAFYPPTDLRGWVNNPPAVIKEIPALHPPLKFDAAKEESVSPIVHVSDTTAPILLIHGDKDLLVPIEHSTKIMTALDKTQAIHKLVTVQGAAHGFDARQQAEIVQPEMLGWFDEHLKAK